MAVSDRHKREPTKTSFISSIGRSSHSVLLWNTNFTIISKKHVLIRKSEAIYEPDKNPNGITLLCEFWVVQQTTKY